MRRFLTLFTVLMFGAALAFIPTVVFSQVGTFSGKVTDANGVAYPIFLFNFVEQT